MLFSPPYQRPGLIRLCASVALCLALALCASGCGDLLSLHALVSPQMRVVDPAIEGVWQDRGEELRVTRTGDHYDVIFHPANASSEDVHWQATLTDLNGVRFADLLGPDAIGHMFARVEVNGSELRLTFFDSEWLRARVPHEEADLQDNRKQAVLTGSTPQLRRMLAKYVREPRAFDSQEHVWRK